MMTTRSLWTILKAGTMAVAVVVGHFLFGYTIKLAATQ
jgi:uncharacterized membrane protein YjfL (UPF0719 family)